LGGPTVISATSGQYPGLAVTIPKSHIACHEKGRTEAFLDEVRAHGRLSRKRLERRLDLTESGG
jgi:hypothetical protein